MTWTNCRLGDVLTLARGFDLPASKRKDGEIPIVSSSGVTGYHCEAKLRGPGVVTGRYGTIGDVYFIEGDYWPLNTALYVSDFKGCSPRFASYLLRNVLSGYQSDKAAVPGVNRNVLHELRVRKPDLDVQERITDILSSFDHLLENNGRRTTLLEEAARQLYREWFVRLRFPGHEHTPVVGGFPQGWERVSFADVAEFVNGYPFKPDQLGDSGMPVVKIPELRDGVQAKTPMNSGEDIPKKYHLKDKDLLFSWSGTLLIDFWYGGPALLNQHLFRVISGNRCSSAFLIFALREALPEFTNETVGATMKHIRRSALATVATLLPPPLLLAQFDEVACSIFDQILTLRQQNQKLRAARDLLLPRLMSGEIPV
jgi:type I restriction enzyme S subunit